MAEPGENYTALREFFVDRLRHYLAEDPATGFLYDEINAALAASDAEPVDVLLRCQAIRRVRTTPNFEPLAISFKRIRNILEKAGGVERHLALSMLPELLEAGAERDLYDAYKREAQFIASQKERNDYYSPLANIASLRPVVDRFFEDVLVMAKDEEIRENRLAFLARLLNEFSAIADFSEIVTEG